MLLSNLPSFRREFRVWEAPGACVLYWAYSRARARFPQYRFFCKSLQSRHVQIKLTPCTMYKPTLFTKIVWQRMVIFFSCKCRCCNRVRNIFNWYHGECFTTYQLIFSDGNVSKQYSNIFSNSIPNTARGRPGGRRTCGIHFTLQSQVFLLKKNDTSWS